MTTDASVVVPSRGGAARLPILLEALARQRVDASWEVLVVLDGDVDGSGAIVDGYAERLPLRVLGLEPGGDGVAAVLAAGYAAAYGEVVIRCDDDLTPAPDFVARHLAWHRDRLAGAPPLGVIGLTRDVFDDGPYAEAYGRPANERLLAAAYARPADQRWLHWAACNSVPRAAYHAAGGFDPTMAYREDSELGLRLARSGVELVIDPALEIEHRAPAADAAARVARAWTSGASTRAFGDRHRETVTSTAHRVTTAWTRLVAAQARRLRTRDDAARLGRRVDRLLPRVPGPARGRLVAWAVEAAAVAGRRSGDVGWPRAEPTDRTRRPITDAVRPRTIDIVIAHHGDPAPTLALVDQLRSQHQDQHQGRHRGQIIVADDASPHPFPPVEDVTVVRRERNGGFGSAVNSGAATATADCLLVLNSDLTIPDGFVVDMLAAAQRFPDAVLAPRVVDEAGDAAWVGRDFPRARHQAVEWLTPLARWRHTDAWHRAVGHDPTPRHGDASVDWVIGAAMLVPTAAFRGVSGFDERFFMNSEEVDLQRRLRARGVPSIALSSPTVVHAGGGSSPSPTRRRWLVESRLLYADKWASRRALTAALLVSTGANLTVNAARRAAGRDVAPLQTAREEIALLRGRR